MSEAALAFESASKRYRSGTLALDRVSWSIAPGARACLLGPNGAGKSTAIRLLEGALAPTAGRVTLLGTPVGGAGYAAARRRTGIVPQSAGMYADLTTREYLELSRRLYGRGDLGAIVEVFGLGPHLASRLAQLSGGFQRRAVLAAALLSEPELLLLDEPTVGLDPVAAHELHEFLRRVMAGRTTLLSTHDLAEAETLCDEVVILLRGTVRLHEPLATLRARVAPRTRLVARQPAEAVAAAVRRRGLDAVVQDGGALVTIDPERDAPALLRALLAEAIDVYECRAVRPTLEELFLGVVGEGA